MASIADEPGVAEILARAGLAGGRPAWKLRPLRRAGNKRLAHHRIHHCDVTRLDDAPKLLWRVREQDFTSARAHARDHVWHGRLSAVREPRVSTGEPNGRHFRGAECERRVGVEF